MIIGYYTLVLLIKKFAFYSVFLYKIFIFQSLARRTLQFLILEKCSTIGLIVKVQKTAFKGVTAMNTLRVKLHERFQNLISREEGQDLVEYVLIGTLLALSATASLSIMASAVSTGFSTITTSF